MGERAKTADDLISSLEMELQEKAKDAPELTRQLEAFKQVVEDNTEILQRLADS